MEIAPGIHVMGSKKGGYVRAFLLDDGTDLTLIDTLRSTGFFAAMAQKYGKQ